MYESAEPHDAPRHVSVSEARQDLAELVNRAAYRGERVLVSRRGRAIAAIVPIEDIESLERYEDEILPARGREGTGVVGPLARG